METILLHGEQEKELEKAAQLLRAGETVAFPTETVYGPVSYTHLWGKDDSKYFQKNIAGTKILC